MTTHTNQDQGVTKAELADALKPIERRLENVEEGLKVIKGKVSDTQEDVKAIKNFLMPMPPEDGNDGD